MTIKDFIVSNENNAFDFIQIEYEIKCDEWISLYFSNLEEFRNSSYSYILDFSTECEEVVCVYAPEDKKISIGIFYPNIFREEEEEFTFLLPWFDYNCNEKVDKTV